MLTYRIHRGGYDDFAIDGATGIISVARKLDYDKRESYDIEIVATDGGMVAWSFSFIFNLFGYNLDYSASGK